MNRKKLKLARAKFAVRADEATAVGNVNEAIKWQEAIIAADESMRRKVPGRNKGPRSEHMKKMREALAKKRALGQAACKI